MKTTYFESYKNNLELVVEEQLIVGKYLGYPKAMVTLRVEFIGIRRIASKLWPASKWLR